MTEVAGTTRAAREPSGRPRLLDMVFWGYVGAAGLNLAVGAWTVAFIPAALEEVRAGGQAPTAVGVFLAFAIVAAATIAFSLALAVLALRLRRGRSWARPALLTVSLLSLVAIVTGGTPGFAVILVLAVLAFLVTRSPISLWLRAASGRPSP